MVFSSPINRVVLFEQGHMQPIRSGEISKSPRSKLMVELDHFPRSLFGVHI